MECMSLAMIKERLDELKEWSLDGMSITKEKSFSNFKEAADFVNKIGNIVDEHHPDLFILHNNVRLILTTRKEGCVTEKDFELAKKIDELV